MAKLKFGEGLKLEVDVPEPKKQTSQGPVVMSPPSASEMAVEVAKHIKIPKAAKADLSPIRAELERLSKDVIKVSASVEDICPHIEAGLSRISKIEDKMSQAVDLPEVKEITVHRDHSAELNALRNHVLDIQKKFEEHCKKEKTINLALGVGLILTTIAHLL